MSIENITQSEGSELLKGAPAVEVYLLRHAETSTDKSSPTRGLTEDGRQQVKDAMGKIIAGITDHKTVNFRVYDSGTSRTREQSVLEVELLLHAGVPEENIYLSARGGSGVDKRLSVDGLEGNFEFRKQRESEEYLQKMGAKDGILAWALTDEADLPEGVENYGDIASRIQHTAEQMERIVPRMIDSSPERTTVIIANSHAPFVTAAAEQMLNGDKHEMTMARNAEGIKLAFDTEGHYVSSAFTLEDIKEIEKREGGANVTIEPELISF